MFNACRKFCTMMIVRYAMYPIIGTRQSTSGNKCFIFVRLRRYVLILTPNYETMGTCNYICFTKLIVKGCMVSTQPTHTMNYVILHIWVIGLLTYANVPPCRYKSRGIYLANLSQVMHICVSNISNHWFSG